MDRKAFMLISKYFKNKKDKGGNPYTQHLFSVYEKVKCNGFDVSVVALLHDIVEDTDIALEDLVSEGFSSEVVGMIEILTRREEETYKNYINRVLESDNYGALIIKKADLEDNINISRLGQATEKDMLRIRDRYIPAWLMINKKINDMGRKYDKGSNA